MSKFSIPITTAVALFPFIALLITVPFMVHKYRKLGSVPISHALIVYSFVFYLMCAYFLVLLPLPADRTAYFPHAATPQLEPFRFLRLFAQSTDATLDNPASWPSVITNVHIYEAFFNVLLLLPLGAYLRYYFKRTWWQTLIIGFCVSLSFELTQLTGIWGIYEHPYRLFDVDDLMTNTAGAMIGFWLTGPFLRILPDLRIVERNAKRRGRTASATRRALSFGIDLVIAIGVATVIFGIAKEAADAQNFRAGINQTAFWVSSVAGLVIAFAMAPLITRGQTFGQKLLHLHVVTNQAEKASWLRVAARYGVLFAILFVPAWAFSLIIGIDSAPTSTQEIKQIAASAINGPHVLEALWAVGVLTWIASLLLRAWRAHRGHEPFIMLNGLVTGTEIMTADGLAAAQARRRALDVAEVVELERAIAAAGTPLDELMRRAGAAVADEVRAWAPNATPVVILCGSGNNGGDGWVCARELARDGWPVTLVTPKAHEQLKAEPARSEAFTTCEAAAQEKLPLTVMVAPDSTRVAEAMDGAGAVVDAILGTGFSGESVREPYATWINLANRRRFSGTASQIASPKNARNRDPKPPTAQHQPDGLLVLKAGRKAKGAPLAIAVDVPSGLSAQTGTAALPRFYADETVTMLAFKSGLLAKAAEPITGFVELAELVPSETIADFHAKKEPQIDR